VRGMTPGSRPWTTESMARHPAVRLGSTSARLPGLARLAIVLEILLGIGAVGGGSMFILAPDGHLLGMPLKMLAGTPFHSFLVPGLLLFTLCRRWPHPGGGDNRSTIGHGAAGCPGGGRDADDLDHR
jgi:hypothetical protein